MENDLRGQNRPLTNCAQYKYVPSNEPYVQGKEYIKPVTHPKVSTEQVHLPACQMIGYGVVPNVPLATHYSQCPQK